MTYAMSNEIAFPSTVAWLDPVIVRGLVVDNEYIETIGHPPEILNCRAVLRFEVP